MAIFWTAFASFLVVISVVNGQGSWSIYRSDDKPSFEAIDDVNDEDVDIDHDGVNDEKRTAPITFSRRCQLGTFRVNCFPKRCTDNTYNTIRFRKRYLRSPKVVVSLSGLRVDKRFNTGLLVTPVHVTPLGFRIRFYTRDDTGILRVFMTWVACPVDP